ncbi:hypothetical protein, conserved [Eimeria brunetti]|uniref:Uncharacterized protein n=1 Tax=Eimeria brunetti TaxID=51314 RepID=U6LFF7_9EIME|nr:hypothetical protein, conserved [Eimeria brunetti]
MRSKAAPAYLLLLLCLCLAATLAKANAAKENSENTTVEQPSPVEVPAAKSPNGDARVAEAVDKDIPITKLLDDGFQTMEKRPKVRGLKTAVTAMLLIAGYLVAHMLGSPERGPSALVHVESLDAPENLWLASAAAVLGMLFSGLGELAQSVLLKNGQHAGLAKKKRGMLQMVIAAFLYISCIGASFYLGPFLALSRLQAQILSLAAAGLFFWGAALYFDPFLMVN